jgi:Sec-independent protein translocase protein TatA
MKGLGIPQLLIMFAVVIIIFGLFKSGFMGGPRD